METLVDDKAWDKAISWLGEPEYSNLQPKGWELDSTLYKAVFKYLIGATSG